MWFQNYQHSNVGIHNARRCVMRLSLNGTQARGHQILFIFLVTSLNSSKIYIFLTVYHWDKQVIDSFLLAFKQKCIHYNRRVNFV